MIIGFFSLFLSHSREGVAQIAPINGLSNVCSVFVHSPIMGGLTGVQS